MTDLTAAEFAERLRALQDPVELEKIQRYFKTGPGEYGEGDIFMGVKMGKVFALAKEFIDMPSAEIEKLLDDPIHEMRAGACSIMSKQATDKKTSGERRRELYDLYLRRHDRINNWDLVDLAARRSRPPASSTTAILTISTRSPRSCCTTPRTSSTRRSVGGSATRARSTGHDC